MSTIATRRQMAQQIVDWEARRDHAGQVMVYILPANDGGGSYEVCGINEKYDTPVAAILSELVQTARQGIAEIIAVVYIAQNTDAASHYTTNDAVEMTLRDIIFNRGLGGMTKTLQHAVGVIPDGQFGPASKAAVAEAEKNPAKLLQDLHDARAWYEENVVGIRSNFEAGLKNRWDNCLAFSKTLLQSVVLPQIS